jgi:hypothetical protein
MMLLGGFLILALFLLTGANGTPSPEVGRYRMSVSLKGNFTHIYVIDTTTGIVKYVGKDEGKPFGQISGK